MKSRSGPHRAAGSARCRLDRLIPYRFRPQSRATPGAGVSETSCGGSGGVRSSKRQIGSAKVTGSTGRLGVWPGLGLRDQALAEAPRRRLGAIATALDRQVGALAVARAIAVRDHDSGHDRVRGFPSAVRGTDRRFAGGSERRRAERWLNAGPAGGRRRGSRPRFRSRSPSRRGSRRRLAITRRGVGLVGRTRRPAVEVLGFDVRDVQEAVAADREVDERGLDRRLEVDDPSLVDVAGVALVAGALDVKLLENAVLDDGDPAFLGLFAR